MKAIRIKLLVMTIILLSACSQDDGGNMFENIQSSCGIEYDTISSGTKCCMVGPEFAGSNEIISVTYTSNIENALYSWEVLGGSMVITEGEHSSTARFKAEKNFIKDTIVGESHSADGTFICSNFIVVTSSKN